MRYGSADFNLLTVDGYDLLGAKPQSFTERREAVVERVDGLGDKVEAQGPTGLTKITITQGGAFFDDTQHRMHAAFAKSIVPAATRTLVYSFTGGKTVTTVAGVYAQSYAVIAQQGRLTKAAVTYQVNGVPTDSGKLVQGGTPQTASWTGAAVDLGAAAPNGADFVAQILDLTGGTLVGTIEQSADGLTGWATVATFPTVDAATATIPLVQSLTVATAVSRYVRYKGTLTGTTPTARVAVIITPHP